MSTLLATIPGRVDTVATYTDTGLANNKLGAQSDVHAVEMWLSEHTPGTRREYARHSARLLAWLASVHLSFHDCTYGHLQRYFDQLDDPALLRQHAARFLSSEAQSAFLKLFAIDGEATDVPSTVKPRAARARKIIVAMFRWLQLSGYISTIAIPKVGQHDASDTDTSSANGRTELQREQLAQRVLADHQWAIVDAAIERLDWQQELQSRCRAIAVWLRESGARRQELAVARLDAMQRHGSGTEIDPTVWLWRITGKGKKVRYVAVTPAMIDSFKRYRLSRGIPFFEDDPFLVPRRPSQEASADSYLFYGVYDTSIAMTPGAHQGRAAPKRRSASTTTIYNDIRLLAKAAATLCTSDADRDRISKLSPHWFRHRRALELTRRLTPMQVAQYLGHSSIETTRAYSMDDEVDLARAVLGVVGG